VSQLGDGQQPGATGETNTPAQQDQKPEAKKDEQKAQEPQAQEQEQEPATQEKQPASETEAKETFVRDYFAQAPGGTDQAWEMLGPSLQEQGRGSYDAFWRTIESVEVRSAVASRDSDVVEVTLTYRTTDGKVSTERKREGLVQSSDGGYLLDTDVPAS
jgi:hypothetical protein